MSNSHDLAGLFSPKAVALVGATDHPTSFGGRVFQQMTGFGFGGKIYPVNPRLKELSGYTCYPSVLDLPERPDHVGLIVSTARVFDVLEDCAKIGVPFATVFSGGFAEMGTEEGRLRQARLVEFAKRSGMRIMGPNCNGIVNFVDRFAMTSTAAIKGPRVPPGDIAVVSHSGGFGQINIMYRAMEIGLGISYQASCGNEADIDTLDFARFMLNAEATRVLLMAVESIKDGEKFRTLARESAELEKPIVILKAGRTDAGGRAAASHTGAIAGVDEIYDAVFRQYGVTRVYECNELYETAVLLRKRKWPKGRGSASVSPTGGNIVQVADAGAVFGIQWPSYSAETRAGLEALLPGYGQVTNPTDMTSLATGDRALYYKALATITADPAVDTMAPIFASGTVADLRQGGEFIVNSEKQAAMLWVGGCTDDPSFTAKDLIKAGVPVYRDATSCMRAVRATVNFSEYLEAYRAGETEPRRPHGVDREGTAAKLHACGAKLTEREAKDVLAGYGFPVTREREDEKEHVGRASGRESGGAVV
jgi:acetyltransferase